MKKVIVQMREDGSLHDMTDNFIIHAGTAEVEDLAEHLDQVREEVRAELEATIKMPDPTPAVPAVVNLVGLGVSTDDIIKMKACGLL